MKRRQTAPGPRVPELDRVVLGAGDEQAFVRMPVDRLDLPPVPRQHRLLGAGRKVPNLQRGVVGARNELGVGGRNGEAAHGFRVRLHFLDVVEVGLPILDDARLVGRQQPVVRRRVFDGADGGLVRLHDGLEVEAHAVPQRELAARGAREQPAALGRPLDHVDRVLDLVQRRVHGFGGDRGRGACWPRGRRLHVDNIAGTRPLGLAHGLVLVLRPPVAHPLHRRRAIVCDGA